MKLAIAAILFLLVIQTFSLFSFVKPKVKNFICWSEQEELIILNEKLNNISMNSNKDLESKLQSELEAKALVEASETKLKDCRNSIFRTTNMLTDAQQKNHFLESKLEFTLEENQQTNKRVTSLVYEVKEVKILLEEEKKEKESYKNQFDQLLKNQSHGTSFCIRFILGTFIATLSCLYFRNSFGKNMVIFILFIGFVHRITHLEVEGYIFQFLVDFNHKIWITLQDKLKPSLANWISLNANHVWNFIFQTTPTLPYDWIRVHPNETLKISYAVFVLFFTFLFFILQYKHAIQCRDLKSNIESLELKIQSLETTAAVGDRTSNKLDDFKALMMGIFTESFGNISSQNTTANERIMRIISNNESYSKNLDEIKDAMVKNQKETKDKLVGIQDSMVHKESITPLFQDQKTISKRLDGMNFLEKEFETYKAKVQQEKEEFSKKIKKSDSKVSTEKRVLDSLSDLRSLLEESKMNDSLSKKLDFFTQQFSKVINKLDSLQSTSKSDELIVSLLEQLKISNFRNFHDKKRSGPTVHVRGLNLKDNTEENLRMIFDEFKDDILSVEPTTWFSRNSSKKKPFALVEFSTKEAFEKALKLNGNTYFNCEITVEVYDPKKQTPETKK
jgi:hypothetical protein